LPLMASFLGGQEKADVASLAKQAGNVSVWNKKQNPNDKKLNDVTYPLDYLTESIPLKKKPYSPIIHTNDFCAIWHCQFF
jgi:hypothetical protein